MRRAVTLPLVLLAFGVVSASDLRARTSASAEYRERLSQIIDSLPALASDRLVAYGGASIHYSFRIDAAGRISRLRVFAERASDRPAAQVVAQAIRAARLPPPPRNVIAEQKHPWYDVPELIFLPRAD
jgi:hypothetical protein